MRKIKLVFHVGRGKTATTFLQKIGQQLENVIFVGKFYPATEKSNWFSAPIKELHYKLFAPYRHEVTGGYPNPSVNSFKLLAQYAEGLRQMIMEKPNAEILMLSDECISDYDNFLGELNTLLIFALGNLLEEKLGNSFFVNKVLSLTIRNQAELAASAFAYTATTGGTLSTYVDSYLMSPNRSLFGGMFYFECYTLYKLMVNDDWTIKLTPYELLSIDHDIAEYICHTFQLDPNQINVKALDTKAVNVNSKRIGSQKIFIKRKTTVFGRMGHAWHACVPYAYRIARARKQYVAALGYALKYGIGSVFLNLDLFLRHLGFARSTEFILDDLLTKKIQDIYLDDNKMLQELLTKFDLIRYGYLPTGRDHTLKKK
ncbi:hypothetical protein [uncultured Shewanella sp.]|uniref:hypothetical protein n=1 Tax=uncultured Shewanella sp. TaxID=173975 RepID=UPI00261B7A21|nr:hypothetical protein [uncultured Shewanella sp.]